MYACACRWLRWLRLLLAGVHAGSSVSGCRHGIALYLPARYHMHVNLAHINQSPVLHTLLLR